MIYRRDDPGQEPDRKAPRRPNRPGLPRRVPSPLPPSRGPGRTVALWALIVVVSVLVAQLYFGQRPQRVDVSYTRFVEEINKGNIEKVDIVNNEVSGELKTSSSILVGNRPVPFKSFHTYIAGSGESLPKMIWEKNPGIEVNIRPPGTNWWALFGSAIPILIIVGAWFLVLRQMQSGGSAALKFGKSRAKVTLDQNPRVTFKDVAGCDEAKQELQEIVEFLKDPQKFQRLGGRIPKGALLLGPPGTGKTLLAKAVAGEAGVPFFSMSGSDFVEMFVGVGASVAGETPIVVRVAGEVRRTTIGEFVDAYYAAGDSGFKIPVRGVETVGEDGWSGVRGVYRHRVSEIFEIEYVGGTIRATGDHSVFVMRNGDVLPVEARELVPGDALVPLGATALVGVRPDVSLASTIQSWDSDSDRDPIVVSVESKPYDGYVYDLCGCDNEAFFGGDKPVLLHNSRVRDLFDQSKRNAPAIVFIDEIDAVGRHRGAGLGGGHDEREQTLNQLLVEMDGFDSNDGVILIAATNRPDVLDPALLRPGRFDRQVVVDWPDVKGREGILRVHTRDIPLDTDIDLKKIAQSTPGMSGADLANIVNEAALLAARRNKKKVQMPDFEDARDKVTLGVERTSMVINPEQRKRTAYHESGHALVNYMLPGTDPVVKITIIPRGRALGLTAMVPAEDRLAYTRDELLSRVAGMLGGRAADMIVFGEKTTGASNDIEAATNLARKMVCEWGMSEKLGPLALGHKDEMVFLGRDIGHQKNYSEDTAEMIDKEVKEFVEGGLKRALSVIESNRDKLELLANTLLEREQLDGEAMNKLMRGETLPPLDAPRSKGNATVIAPGPGPEFTPAIPTSPEGLGPAPTPAS